LYFLILFHQEPRRAVFLTALDKIEPREKEDVMQIVTSWLREGLQQGLQQGLEQGLQQGLEQGLQQEALVMVLRLLRKRLGSLSPELAEIVASLSVSQLEDLVEAVLDFSSAADLNAWLQTEASKESAVD
jgi:flagellar biosynthesis/type III secretory pathway protein FliH